MSAASLSPIAEQASAPGARHRRFIASTGRWANVAGCLALVEVRDRETYASLANRARRSRRDAPPPR